jgi:hypothetical protein
MKLYEERMYFNFAESFSKILGYHLKLDRRRFVQNPL